MGVDPGALAGDVSSEGKGWGLSMTDILAYLTVVIHDRRQFKRQQARPRHPSHRLVAVAPVWRPSVRLDPGEPGRPSTAEERVQRCGHSKDARPVRITGSLSRNSATSESFHRSIH